MAAGIGCQSVSGRERRAHHAAFISLLLSRLVGRLESSCGARGLGWTCSEEGNGPQTKITVDSNDLLSSPL